MQLMSIKVGLLSVPLLKTSVREKGGLGGFAPQTLTRSYSFEPPLSKKRSRATDPNKCHCMIIPPSTKDFTLDFTLKIDNTIIPSNATVKYLGEIIDSKLSFAPHIKYLESKLSRANGIISRLKSTLPDDALLKLNYALFQPHLLYGLTIWGSTFPTYLNPIKTLQNRAVKNIGSGSMYDNSNPYYVRFNILKLQDLYIVETAKIVYNYCIYTDQACFPLFSQSLQ